MSEILIVCEVGPGRHEPVNTRLLGAAQALQDELGWRTVALVAGPGAEASAEGLRCFADEVLVTEAPALAVSNPELYLALVSDIWQQRASELILLGHTQFGMDLAPRLAIRLDGGLITSCVEIAIDEAGASLSFVRPMHKGRLLARVVIQRSPAIVTLQAAGAAAPSERESGSVARLPFEPPAETTLEVVQELEPARGQVDLTRADVIVSAGRGIGDRENLELIDDLADALGGVTACSRPLVDVGWLDADHQVGMSGRTVRPKLYMACGISGAPEHLAGMSGSDTIVAINTDAEAPIFRKARYGIVGDLSDVLPALATQVRATAAGKET